MDNVFFFVWCIPYFEELNTKNPNYGAFGRKFGMVGWFEGSPAKGQKKRLNILLIFLNGFDRFVCILSGREIIHFLNRLFAAIVFFIFAFPPHPLIVVLRTELLKCFIFAKKPVLFWTGFSAYACSSNSFAISTMTFTALTMLSAEMYSNLPWKFSPPVKMFGVGSPI